MFSLAERFSQHFLLKHVEVIGNDEADFRLRPVFSFLFCLDLLALLDNGEAQLPQDEVSLAGGLAAAEFFWQSNFPQEVAAGEADDCFRRVVFAFVFNFKLGRLSEWVFSPGVQVGNRP